MITLTTQNIIQFSRDKLLEVGDAVVNTEKLLVYANLTQDDLAKDLYTDDMTVPTTLVFTGGYATIPTDWESHRLSKNSQVPGQGDIFEWVNLEDFRAGKYSRMIAKINGQIAVYPTNTSILYTDYFKKLPNMAITPIYQGPSVDASLQELMIDGVLYRAFEDLQEFDLAKEYRGKYEAEKKIKTKRISFAEENPQKSGEMFNGIDIIGGNVGDRRGNGFF